MFTLPPPLPSQQQLLQQQPRHQGQVVPAGLSGYPSEAVLHASRAWMSPSRASSECAQSALSALSALSRHFGLNYLCKGRERAHA